MKYKKYVMMFLAGTMTLTPAAPMVALAEDAASVAESEATEGDVSAETIEESEEKEEAEETEEEVEAEKSKEAVKEAEKTEQAKEAAQTVEGIKNEAVEAQPILLEATETIPMAEENPDLAVGVYSVEYGIKKFGSDGKPTEVDSMAGSVKDGNMIVDVSEKDGQKVYTYYMAVKQAKIMGMDASVTGLQLDGEDVEVYATAEATKAPRVFRFRRTEKEEFFSITSTINGTMDMPAMAVVMNWDTATTEGAAIPEGDTKPEPPAATIPAPIITPAKTEAENGSTVAVTLAMDSQYQAAKIYYTTDGTAPTTDSKSYTAPIQITGANETKTIKAIAVLDGKSSTVSEHSITFKKASNPGKTDEITDGKYWMDVQFYHADKDAVSMGDYALENNRRALVTVKNGTATIDVATNPIYRDGIVSGIGKIESTDKDVTLTVLDTNTNKEYSFEYVESFQVKMNDLTKKFVNVKFTVPNTPMEKLYPNGVPARLKLNFGGMTKANDSASLKPNSKTASKGGSSDEAFDAEDKETGVKLEAGKFVFNNGAELKAAKLTEAKDKETAEKLLKKQAEYIDLFEIKVMNGKTEATPSGTVKISIPVRKSETAVKLYRILPADKKKSASAAELEFTRSKDGKYLELEVKELGQFAVVYAEADEEAPMDDRTEAPVAKESRTDISGHWAEGMIRNAMQKGIMTGVGNGDFAPNAAMTRGMLITALGRMEGVKAGMYEGGSFADVKQEDYFASFVAWAVAENIASGMSETVFAPNAEVTREQLAVFLYQYAQKKGIALTGESKTFTDAEGISDWAKDAVAALTGAGLLNGRPDGSFNAKGKATRAEVATVLVKLAEMTAEK